MAVLLVAVVAGLPSCSSGGDEGKCPGPRILAAPANEQIALSCADPGVTYKGIEYVDWCEQLPKSRIGPIIERLDGPHAKAIRRIVGIDPSHAIILVRNDGCRGETWIATSEDFTSRDEMALTTPVGAN